MTFGGDHNLVTRRGAPVRRAMRECVEQLSAAQLKPRLKSRPMPTPRSELHCFRAGCRHLEAEHKPRADARQIHATRGRDDVDAGLSCGNGDRAKLTRATCAEVKRRSRRSNDIRFALRRMLDPP